VDLDELVRTLRAIGDPRRHRDATTRLLADCRFELPPLPRRPRHYTRSLIYRDAHLELLVLRWSAGAATPIHDHDGQECWFLPLAGAFTCWDYRLDGNLRLVERRDGVRSLDYQPGGAQIHRVAAPGPSLSLHLYAAPVDRCRVYDAAGRAAWLHNHYDMVVSDNYLPSSSSASGVDM
jgi:predicted metal-dependent enzyme (double-stranded beta helix superfamily)